MLSIVIDNEWASVQLRRFLDMTALRRPRAIPGVIDGTGRMLTASSDEQIVPEAHVIEKILEDVLPDWRSQNSPSRSDRWVQHREACQRALAQLNRDAELREHLGGNSPQLDASHLHPWVWEGTRSRWQSGHYGDAVQAASRKINAEAKKKIRRTDIGESELLQLAFSPSPPKPGEARLRLSADDGSKTFRSLHAGAGAFAVGCYSAFRNPGSHEDEVALSQDEALEQLVAFSILARWIERADVVRDRP